MKTERGKKRGVREILPKGRRRKFIVKDLTCVWWLFLQEKGKRTRDHISFFVEEGRKRNTYERERVLLSRGLEKRKEGGVPRSTDLPVAVAGGHFEGESGKASSGHPPGRGGRRGEGAAP